MSKIKASRGFTLLELLIAISIFGIVAGVAYSSYNTSFSIIKNAEEKASVYSKGQVAMERIMTDLESVFIGDGAVFIGISGEISGNRTDSLEFTSTAFVKLHPHEAPPGTMIISYTTEENPDYESESLHLYRAQYNLNADRETKEKSRLLLCDNLKEVAFDYRDQDNQELENWDLEKVEQGDPPLPAMIKIRLRFNDSGSDEPGTLFQTAITSPLSKEKITTGNSQ